MVLSIDIEDETNELSDEQMNDVVELLRFVAKQESIEEDAEVSVLIVTNERIQQLNGEYRDKPVPTDVLSFAMEEETEDDEFHLADFEMPRMLGDIIISIEKAREQANDYGHSFMRELAFLSVHGFLHLLGYDHETEEEERVMFQKQRELLNAYGFER